MLTLDFEFCHCTGVASIANGYSVTSIDGIALSDCSGLIYIIIVVSVTNVARLISIHIVLSVTNGGMLISIHIGVSVTEGRVVYGVSMRIWRSI